MMGSPPIKFHKVHGNNIRLCNNGTDAIRVESFNQGLCFTERPLEPEEKLVIKIVESCKSWSGTLRVGVTCNDPRILAQNLPKYVCPDLNMRPGFWGKALEENNVTQNKEIVIYYKRRGVVMIQVANQPPEEFISGISTNKPLYVLFDVYGNTKSIHIKLRNSAVNSLAASGTVVTVPKCETFPDAALTAASFVEFKSATLSVDKKLAKHGEASDRSAFAVAETRLIPGRTLIVNIAGLLHAQPITIVITTEDLSVIQACRSLEKLCDIGYSLSFESDVPKFGDDLAISLARNGAVYVSHSNRRWIPRVHVDEKVEYHIVFSMENVSLLRMLGMTEDLTPVCEEPSVPAATETTTLDCVICLETTRNVLLEPCNHLALCEDCARSLMRTAKRECPVCRALIKGVRKVYVI